jgi:hypothetical protein
VKSPGVRKTICGLFAISEHNYSAILGSYLQNKTIYSSDETGEGRTGNSNAKDGRVPYTKAMTISQHCGVCQGDTSQERKDHCEAGDGVPFVSECSSYPSGLG